MIAADVVAVVPVVTTGVKLLHFCGSVYCCHSFFCCHRYDGRYSWVMPATVVCSCVVGIAASYLLFLLSHHDFCCWCCGCGCGCCSCLRCCLLGLSNNFCGGGCCCPCSPKWFRLCHAFRPLLWDLGPRPWHPLPPAIVHAVLLRPLSLTMLCRSCSCFRTCRVAMLPMLCLLWLIWDCCCGCCYCCNYQCSCCCQLRRLCF